MSSGAVNWKYASQWSYYIATAWCFGTPFHCSAEDQLLVIEFCISLIFPPFQRSIRKWGEHRMSWIISQIAACKRQCHSIQHDFHICRRIHSPDWFAFYIIMYILTLPCQNKCNAHEWIKLWNNLMCRTYFCFTACTYLKKVQWNFSYLVIAGTTFIFFPGTAFLAGSGMCEMLPKGQLSLFIVTVVFLTHLEILCLLFS